MHLDGAVAGSGRPGDPCRLGMDDAINGAMMAEPPMTTTSVSACPRCGSSEIARIQYGEPAYSPTLEADLDAHRVVLGGCMVGEGQPDRACTTCGLEFRRDGRPATLPEGT